MYIKIKLECIKDNQHNMSYFVYERNILKYKNFE